MSKIQKAFNEAEKLSQGSMWQHKKSGKLYTITCITNLMAAKPDFVQQVVYEDEDMQIWSRPLSEWNDKFTFIKPA